MKFYEKLILTGLVLFGVFASASCGAGNKDSGNYSGAQQYVEQGTPRTEKKWLVTKRSDLRKECKENSDVIRTVNPGAVAYEIGDAPSLWYRVRIEDETGCMKSSGLGAYGEHNLIFIQLKERLFDEDYLLYVLRRGVDGQDPFDHFTSTAIKALADLKSPRAVDLLIQYLDSHSTSNRGRPCDTYRVGCGGYKLAFNALKQIGTPQAKQKLANELLPALDRRLHRARVERGGSGSGIRFATDVRPVEDAEAGGKIFAELGEFGAYDVVDGMTKHFFQALTFCRRYNQFEYPYPLCSDRDVEEAFVNVATNSEENRRRVKEFLTRAIIDIYDEPFAFLEKHKIVDDPEIRAVFYWDMASGAKKTANEILQRLGTGR